jgi:mannose-6-phosphate isomerase class I
MTAVLLDLDQSSANVLRTYDTERPKNGKKNYRNFSSSSFAKVFVRLTKSFFTSHLLSKIEFLLKEGNLLISWNYKD